MKFERKGPKLDSGWVSKSSTELLAKECFYQRLEL